MTPQLDFQSESNRSSHTHQTFELFTQIFENQEAGCKFFCERKIVSTHTQM